MFQLTRTMALNWCWIAKGSPQEVMRSSEVADVCLEKFVEAISSAQRQRRQRR